MRARWWAAAMAAMLLFAACSGGGGGTGSPGTTGGTATDGGTAFDPNSVSGDLTLQGFSAGNVEDELLNDVLATFMEKYPNIKVKFETIAAEYPTVTLTQLGAGDAPDLFYVQQGYAQEWIRQGVLQDLDALASERGFDTSAFYPGYLSPFQADGKTYGFPKDSSLLALQYNTAMLEEAGIDPPTTTDELRTALEALKDSGVDAPLCGSNEYARVGAFIESNGGGMLTDDLSAAAIDSPESREALEWYLQLYEDELAKRPVDMGVDWCGQALGEEKVAFSFEGNWIRPYMETNFPDVEYAVGPIPTAKEPATLSFTAAYAISPNAPNKDASWVLLSYLTGQEGMQEWANGGFVLPARTDVDAAENLAAYAAGGEVAHPGEGLVPGWSTIQDAFNNSMTAAIEGNGSVDDVISASKSAVDAALAGQ